MAFVRIGKFTAKPELITDLRTIYEHEAIPKIRETQGNISAVLLEQHNAVGEFLAVTVWESRAAAEAYDVGGHAAAMVAKVRHTFAGVPTLTTYEAYGLPPISVR